MRTLEQIREVVKKKGYAFFENKDYNLNIIAVRENDVFENTFSDRLYVPYKADGIWQMFESKWTTLAGTKGHGGEQRPLTGSETGTGVSGVAVIIPNQYRSVYQFVDSYSGFLKYPYYAQVGLMDYWRDNDKNGVVTKGKIYKSNYATLLHRMSNNGVQTDVVNLDYVPWSQGCNGSPEPQFKGLVDITRQAVKIHGSLFTYTLLEASDF